MKFISYLTYPTYFQDFFRFWIQGIYLNAYALGVSFLNEENFRSFRKDFYISPLCEDSVKMMIIFSLFLTKISAT